MEHQRLVVRGDATAVDGPCDAKACPLMLVDGRFRGAPIGAGTYTASFSVEDAANHHHTTLIGRLARRAPPSVLFVPPHPRTERLRR